METLKDCGPMIAWEQEWCFLDKFRTLHAAYETLDP